MIRTTKAQRGNSFFRGLDIQNTSSLPHPFGNLPPFLRVSGRKIFLGKSPLYVDRSNHAKASSPIEPKPHPLSLYHFCYPMRTTGSLITVRRL